MLKIKAPTKNISFTICFHQSRTNNLNQTLRFLHYNEPNLRGSEIVLICQDQSNFNFHSNAFDIKVHNMHMDTYNRPIMVNKGVELSKNEIVVILDSDRILPFNYFFTAASIISSKDVITTINLFDLRQPYTDEQIQSGDIIKFPDPRSINNKSRQKNLFSGNTMMLKEKFNLCGGMDESYVGYGFADNDMTENIKLHNLNPIFLEEEELHLYHSKEIIWNNAVINTIEIFTAINALRFFKKWNKTLDNPTIELISKIKKNIIVYPKGAVDLFEKSLNDLFYTKVRY